MNEEEILEMNYDEGKQKIKDTIRRLDEIINKLLDVNYVITYGKDGYIIDSIIIKLKKSKEQANYMLTRFNKLNTEIVVSYRQIHKRR